MQVSFLTLSDGSDTVTHIGSVPARADEGLQTRANVTGNYIGSFIYSVVYLLIGLQIKTNHNICPLHSFNAYYDQIEHFLKEGKVRVPLTKK